MSKFEPVPLGEALVFAGITRNAWHNIIYEHCYPARPDAVRGKNTTFDSDDLVALYCLGEMIRFGCSRRGAGRAASQVRVYLKRQKGEADQLWILQRSDDKPPVVTNKQPRLGGITLAVDVAGMRKRLERSARPARQEAVTERSNGTGLSPSRDRCLTCGDFFRPKRSTMRFCSADCRRQSYRRLSGYEANGADQHA